MTTDDLDDRLDRIGRHPFRAKFRLWGRDRAVVDLRGIATVRKHAEDLIDRRLAPAEPRNDGKQTPYRGHPVFVAQHATATCCRTCLARWHGIPAGHALDDAERAYVVEAICRWIVHRAPVRPTATTGVTGVDRRCSNMSLPVAPRGRTVPADESAPWTGHE